MENTTTLSNNLHSFYQKVLLETAEKKLKLRQFADEKLHPKGTGKDYFLLKYGNIADNITPLTEGTVPAETTIDNNKYTVSILEYGNYIKLTQLLKYTAIDDTIKSVSERFGFHAAKTMDTVIRDTLVANATSNIQYVGSGNTVDNDIGASETFKATDALKAVGILKGADAPELNDGMYAWVMHPYNSIDIQADTAAGGFIDLNKYVAGLADKPLMGEVGKVYGARVIESSNIGSVANAGLVNVYRSLVIADKSYCITKFNSDAIKILVKGEGSAGTADPLDQFSTVGYKMQFGVKYLGGTFANANGGSPDLVIQVRGASSNG